MESRLQQLETSDSTQIAVLIIPSLEGEPISDYSMRVVEAWKLGQKGRENGVLLFVALKDREVRIEVGYGLEATLTDARSDRIIRDAIGPRFKQGDYNGGLTAGIDGIIGTVRGTYTADPTAKKGPRWNSNLLIVLLFPLLWILSATGKWGGGIIGAGGGMLLPYTLIGHSLLLLLFGGVIGGVFGISWARSSRQDRVEAAGQEDPAHFWGGGFGGFGGGSGGVAEVFPAEVEASAEEALPPVVARFKGLNA